MVHRCIRRDRIFDAPVTVLTTKTFGVVLLLTYTRRPAVSTAIPLAPGIFLICAISRRRGILKISTLFVAACAITRFPFATARASKPGSPGEIHHRNAAQISAPQRTRESQDSNRD